MVRITLASVFLACSTSAAVFFVHGFLLRPNFQQQPLEGLRFARVALALKPGVQERMGFFRLGQIGLPSFENFGMKRALLRLDRPWPSCRRRSASQNVPPAARTARVTNLLSSFSAASISSLCFFQAFTSAFGNERVLLVCRTREHAGQRVVILRREGVVFVIVTTGASHRHAEHATGHHVHPVVPLIGPGLRRLRDAVIPGAQSDQAGGRQQRANRSSGRRRVAP